VEARSFYDGTFSKTPVRGEGITAALLRKNGIVVFSEEELEAAEKYVLSLESAVTAFSTG
jgi:uncharacterized protein YbbK (DUF523 family)